MERALDHAKCFAGKHAKSSFPPVARTISTVSVFLCLGIAAISPWLAIGQTKTPRVSIFSQGKADSFTVPRPFSPRNRGIKRYCVRIYIYMYILCTRASSSGRRFSLLLDNNPRLRNVVIEEREARTGRKRTGGKFYFYLCRKIVDARQHGGGEEEGV